MIVPRAVSKEHVMFFMILLQQSICLHNGCVVDVGVTENSDVLVGQFDLRSWSRRFDGTHFVFSMVLDVNCWLCKIGRCCQR